MIKELTKEEFCELTNTPENCWIFNNANPEAFRFYMEDDVVFFMNGQDTIWQFRHMLEYNEIRVSHSGLDVNSLWTPFEVWCEYEGDQEDG